MEKSILKSIGYYSKINGVTFDKISFKINDSFPESFYEVIIQNLKKININYQILPKIKEYFLNFDENGNQVIDHSCGSTTGHLSLLA